jgi:hypothetical protein
MNYYNKENLTTIEARRLSDRGYKLGQGTIRQSRLRLRLRLSSGIFESSQLQIHQVQKLKVCRVSDRDLKIMALDLIPVSQSG